MKNPRALTKNMAMVKVSVLTFKKVGNRQWQPFRVGNLYDYAI